MKTCQNKVCPCKQYSDRKDYYWTGLILSMCRYDRPAVHVDDQWPWHSTSVVHFVQYIWCSLSKMKNYVLKWHLFTEQLFWSHVHPVHFYVSLYVRFYTCLFFSCVNAPRSPGAQIPSQPPLTLVKFIRKSEKKSTIFENEECIQVQTSLILVYRMLIYFGNLMGHKLMYM